MQRELDPAQLLALDEEDRVRELVELSRMIPVPVPDEDLGHVPGPDADRPELIEDGHPAHAADQVDEVLERRPIVTRLDAGVAQEALLGVGEYPVVDGALE